MGTFTPLRLVANQLPNNWASEPPDSLPAPETIFACVPCSDTGWIVTERGAKPCECQVLARRRRLLERIPPEYRGLDLATIQPDASRHEKQARLFAALKANPDMSLLLSGRVGCGKSLAGWLLYKRAIEQGRPVAALPLAELLAQYRSQATGGEIAPAVTSEELRDDRRRWLIYLDEFDKARASEFAGEQLFLLMDAVYTYRHQLVITSNLTKDGLRAHWSQSSEQYGVSIMRRILELDGLAWEEMF